MKLGMIGSLVLVLIAIVLQFRKIYKIERKNQVLYNDKLELLKALHIHVDHGEYAGQMLKNQHIYCFKALKTSPYLDFVCSLINPKDLPYNVDTVTEEKLLIGIDLWDTGYCTMCDKVHVADVIDVGLLRIYKVIFDNWQANDKPSFEDWVTRDIGIRVRKNPTDFEILAENLDKHLEDKS